MKIDPETGERIDPKDTKKEDKKKEEMEE